MIPRRSFWAFDLSTMCAAFVVAHLLVAPIQNGLAAAGFMQVDWIAALSPAPDWSREPLERLLWILMVAAPPTVFFMEVAGRFGRWAQQSMLRIVVASMAAPITGFACVALVLFALRNPTLRLSRLFIFLFILLSGIGLAAYRIALHIYYKRRLAAGYYAKNVLFAGLPAGVNWMVHYFGKHVSPADYRLLGYLRVPNGHRNGEADADPSLTCMGHVEELGELLIHRPVHEVVAIQPATGGEWMTNVIRDCDHLGILLRIVPEALLFGGTSHLQTLYPFQALHLPAVILAPPHWDSGALFVKRLIDFVVSGFMLTLLAPVFVIIAAAIKLTSPKLPVFYRWNVVGMNGVEFTGYKFTTMFADADSRKQELMGRNEMTGPVFKIKDDPRVTPVGRFLRKYSLNELPQLWSVLKGDMSLVGPRPAFRHELDRYEFWHKRKLSIKPGITCLWQVSGRNRINRFDDWVQLDLEYIDHWSLWLDLRIMLRTVWVVIAGTGS
jgi:exopolysaccharide biosynthesis polyprenyl glycosylphosphotransferase